MEAAIKKETLWSGAQKPECESPVLNPEISFLLQPDSRRRLGKEESVDCTHQADLSQGTCRRPGAM